MNNTVGAFNIGMGDGALMCNISGIGNIAIGSSALGSCTPADYNIALGFLAMLCSAGTMNIGIGRCAGCNLTTGANNTVIGSLPAAAGCVCTVLIGAGTCERIRVDNSGLYINNTLLSGGGGGTFTGGTITGATSITDATASTSTTTGALTVTGGVGVRGAVYAGSFFQGGLSTTTNIQIGPGVILNDISNQFDGTKAVFPLQLEQDSISTLVDSKDIEVTLNGQVLKPHVTEYRYPWITEYDSYKGFRVISAGSSVSTATTNYVEIFNVPAPGDDATITVKGISASKQYRRYPYSAASIAFGD
jgi:hypothetical protein